MTLRKVLEPADRADLESILSEAGVFGQDEVAIGLELYDETMNPGPSTDYRWFLADRDHRVVGFACYGPIPLTVGSFDLYWIAVNPLERGTGLAGVLESAVADAVRGRGGRWLLAETSSTSPYVRAHRFYEKQGYQLLSRIPDFYKLGDDRLTFGKRLDQPRPAAAPAPVAIGSTHVSN